MILTLYNLNANNKEQYEEDHIFKTGNIVTYLNIIFKNVHTSESYKSLDESLWKFRGLFFLQGIQKFEKSRIQFQDIQTQLVK